jgi:hypothetical protein
MKKLFLLMALVLGSALCQAQTSEPFKKASKIEVQTSLTPHQAYKVLGQVLQGHGYGVASSDATLGSITSTFKEIKNAQVQVFGRIEGDSVAVIHLTGIFNGLSTNTPIVYRGAKGSIFMNAWEELETIAHKIQNTTILYR